MPTPLATWNPARGVWETAVPVVVCGHLELFSGAWPTSGMTRRGSAYALPTLEPHMAGSEFSSPPGLFGDQRREGGPTLRQALLRTPTAQLAVNGGSQHPDKRRAGGHGPTLADEVEHLLPRT